MKKKILSSVALACLLAYAPQPAHADITADAIVSFSSFVDKYPDAITKGCKKADFLGGTFSVRSLEGNFCRHPVVAAWALKSCPAVASDFGQSKCRAIAVTTLDSIKLKDPEAAGSGDPELALIQEVNKVTASVKAKLCAHGSNGGSALAKACSTSPAAVRAMTAPTPPPMPIQGKSPAYKSSLAPNNSSASDNSSASTTKRVITKDNFIAPTAQELSTAKTGLKRTDAGQAILAK